MTNPTPTDALRERLEKLAEEWAGEKALSRFRPGLLIAARDIQSLIADWPAPPAAEAGAAAHDDRVRQALHRLLVRHFDMALADTDEEQPDRASGKKILDDGVALIREAGAAAASADVGALPPDAWDDVKAARELMDMLPPAVAWSEVAMRLDEVLSRLPAAASEPPPDDCPPHDWGGKQLQGDEPIPCRKCGLTDRAVLSAAAGPREQPAGDRLSVEPDGMLRGTLPCGHDVALVRLTYGRGKFPEIEGAYCAECAHAHRLAPAPSPTAE